MLFFLFYFATVETMSNSTDPAIAAAVAQATAELEALMGLNTELWQAKVGLN